MSTFVRIPDLPIELVFAVPITARDVQRWVEQRDVVILPLPGSDAAEYVLNWGSVACVEISAIPGRTHPQLECVCHYESKRMSVVGRQTPE